MFKIEHKIAILTSQSNSEAMREWFDRLLEHFKNIFTALKSRQVMNKTVYKKC
jgi:hypothetical protein